MRPSIDRLDHVVLTVRDPEATCRFYESALGLAPITFANGRRGLQVGEQKINLHQAGAEFVPHASAPTPGSADFCLTTRTDLDSLTEHLGSLGIDIEHGPVSKHGARGPLRSVYFRDPDGNLVEVANEVAGPDGANASN